MCGACYDVCPVAIDIPEDEVPGAVAGLLPPGSRVVLPEGFPDGLLPAGLDTAGLDTADTVITTCALAIAETGTLVLDGGPGQGRRALSLIPDRHVCLVRVPQILESVAEALARLDPRRPQTWISGPSATSDIELARVEGVHGPRHLHVLVLDG
ncbi:LUD domain-containing protein [Actinomadura viridis]|uniref:LutC/YkgG family protein n=1 Tax=Actinomadura viridis TaxID=58110 RepID=UPI0036A0DFF2